MALTLTITGCTSNTTHPTTQSFTHATIQRSHAHPEFAAPVTLTGDELQELLRFFPGAGKPKGLS